MHAAVAMSAAAKASCSLHYQGSSMHTHQQSIGISQYVSTYVVHN